jgi:hypothetical protein
MNLSKAKFCTGLLRSNHVLSKSQVLRIFVIGGSTVSYMIQENLLSRDQLSGNKTSAKSLLSERWDKFPSENLKKHQLIKCQNKNMLLICRLLLARSFRKMLKSDY